MNVADGIEVDLLIINRIGMVHKEQFTRTCPAATNAPVRRYISELQARVYRLPACQACWRDNYQYRRHLREEL